MPNLDNTLLDLPTLWSLSGLSWVQAESATGLPEAELRAACEAHGFVRATDRTQTWERGPCLGCGEPYEVEELDEDRRCVECRLPRGSGYRWGDEPPPGHRHWLELERIASAHRRDRREGRLDVHHHDRRQSA